MHSATERIREALHFIPASDRNTWVQMGMAVKSELGEAGFEPWEAWSTQAESFDPKAARAVWKGIHADGKITAGTLFHEAKANGWRDDGTHPKPTPEELAEKKQRKAESDAQAEAEERAKNEVAILRAAEILEAATGDPATHPYPAILKKGINLGPRVKRGKWTQRGWPDALLVPIYRDDGRIWSIEAINVDGTKDSLKDGKKAGGFHHFGKITGAKRVLIGEGLATVAAGVDADGSPGVVALSRTNLKAIGQMARKLAAPNAEIIFLADHDPKPDGTNPGLRSAEEAAAACGGSVSIFGVESVPCDCWDIWSSGGKDAVKQALATARIVGAGDTATGAPASDSGGWPAPMPLPKMPPVPDFPLDILPDGLKAWVGDAADRARFRPDFAAVTSMAALGSVIGRELGIRLKARDDWTEYGNIWAGIIGPPSALKSPGHREGVRPFKVLQVAADAKHAAAMAEYEAQIEAFKLRKDAKKKAAVKVLEKNPVASIDLGDSAAPVAPVARTYWTSDVNEASLGVILERNPNGVLIERDELSSLLVSLEDEGNASLRGMLLSGWSGNEGYRFDRIGRGTTALPKFALSVVGGIQPGPLSRYVRSAFSGERADGLLQRFQLLVWPDAEPFEYVDRWPDSTARQTAISLFERADTFDAEAIGRRDDYGNNPPFVRLSSAAQGLFIEWYSQFMQSGRSAENSISAPLSAHFGKYPGLVGKLALILHVADDPGAAEVSERTLLKSLAWIDYLTPHARRVYHAVEHPETGAAELLLARLRRGELPSQFKAWELTRKAWHGLTDRESVKKACRLLLEYGWLIELDPGGGQGVGRPADPVYTMSPAVNLP